MKDIFNKFKIFIDDLLKVSRVITTKKKKRRIFFLAVINNLFVFFDILIILFFSKIFSEDVNLNNKLIELILENTYILPIIIILRFLAQYLERIVISKLKHDIEIDLKTLLLKEVFNRGNFSISDAYFYVNELTIHIGGFYSTFATFFGSVIQISIFTIYLLRSNLNLVLVFLIGSTLLAIPTIYLTKLGRKYAHLAYNLTNEISDDIEKVLDNFFLIKIVKKVSIEVENFNQNLVRLYKTRLSDIKVGTINFILPNFVTLFGLSLMLVFFNFVKILTLDFIGILLRLFQSLGQVNKNLHLVSSYHVWIEKLYNVLKSQEKIYFDNFHLVDEISEKKQAIKFDNVNFKYFNSGANIFENLNIEFIKNKHTILTGPNGSGKSTILGLCAGILFPNSGKVVSTSSNFGYVGATPLIIRGSLRDNINYGKEESINDEVIYEYIEKFKLFKEKEILSLDTLVSNKSLSTGQMQKIAFIRSLTSNAEILILDESTANLDSETRIFIYDVIKNLDLTIINSTHTFKDSFSYDHHFEIFIENDQRKIRYLK